MRIIRLFGVLMSLMLSINTAVHAQQDAEGCKDHPMFNRMPNTYILECSRNYNEMELPLSGGKHEKKEGTKTFLSYAYDNEKPGTPPSFFQIVKNFEGAIAKYGGKKVYYEAGEPATLYLNTGKKEIWILLEDFSSTNGDGNFAISILEIEEMQQEIQASVIMDKLNKEGHIALYINFENGKSNIRPESQQQITQVADMLAQNPSVHVSIEGHTDNAGTSTTNQKLSESRANAVLNAIVAKGIEKNRLSAKGWGQTKPIADNATENGRALNRRVEIVKMP